MHAKITRPVDPAPAQLGYPILMEGNDGCIALFLSETTAVRLTTGRDPDSFPNVLILDRAPHTLIPPTDSYWRPLKGSITLSNDPIESKEPDMK